MINRVKILSAKTMLWLVLAGPCVVVTFQYMTGYLYYGEFIHATGKYSAQLLIVTLAATPLRLLFPNSRWAIWLLRNRRYFGVATFAYAVPHLLAYLWKLASVEKIVAQGMEPGMWTGWLALAIFLALAITSNNFSVRKLGRRWKVLHRLVYFAAILTFAHWILLAFDPISALVHAGVLALLEGYRVASNIRAGATRKVP